MEALARVASFTYVTSAAVLALDTRSRDDRSQVTLRQTASRLTVTVADEGEAVAKLEVANGNHIPLEAGRSGRHQVSISNTGSNRRSGCRSACGWTSPVPVECASTILSRSTERISGGVGNFEAGVKASLVGQEGEQQVGLASRNCEYWR